MKQTSKYDIFISYRRDGGEYTAKVLRDRLTELGYSVFFDVESLRSGDFNTRLYSVIDECNDFLLILSPNSLDRCVNPDDWVRQEIVRALEKGKNIIPVFLRGFFFPEEMPDPIEPLRFKNGVNANTEFFEAFMEKLLSFLYTKSPMRRRKWTKKAVAGLLILCAVIFAAVTLSRSFMGEPQADQVELYPDTRVEENLTADLIYYVGTCLTQYDIMAGAVEDSLNSFRRYISTGAADSTSMQNQLEVTQNTLQNVDLSTLTTPEDLLTKLADSPFSVSDVRGMESVLLQFQSQWQEYLLFLQSVVDGTIPLPDDDKLKVLECYQTMLEEDEKMNAYSANELFLPITNEDALHDFLYTQMSQLTHIPLNAANWSDNKDALLSAADESFNKMESARNELAILVGNTNMEVNKMKDELPPDDMAEFPQSLIYRTCMLSGLDNEEAVSVTRQMLENPFNVESFHSGSDLAPSNDDTSDNLWGKLRQCSHSSDPVCGSVCTLAIGINATQNKDPNASFYTLAMLYYFQRMAESGENNGVIITNAGLADDETHVFQAGDIILSVDGELSFDTLASMTDSFPDTDMSSKLSETHTATILRLESDGLKEIQLTITGKSLVGLETRRLNEVEPKD